MKMKQIVGIFVINGILLGCSGQLYTVTEARAKPRCDGNYLKGVKAYPPQLYVETYILTAFVVDGKIVRTASGAGNTKCEKALKQSVVTLPNYSEPYQLVYEPGFLETREFGVTLKDGMVTQVNIKGTPDRGETVKNVLSPIAEIASAMMGAALNDGAVLCNANPEFRNLTPYVFPNSRVDDKTKEGR